MDQLRQDLANYTAQVAAHQVPPAEVHRVSVKMPPFWRDRPSLWFAQLEAQFDLANIKEEKTKFAYVVANLQETYAVEVEDIISRPPGVNPYTTIKRELIARTSATEDKRIRQLIFEEELGDKKPSQFLRHLRSLGGNVIQEPLIKTLWLQRLPVQVQAILQTQIRLSTDQLATMADKVLEVESSSMTNVSAIKSPSSDLKRQLEQMSMQFESMQTELSSIRRDLARHESRERSQNISNFTSFCWYHHRFGKRAQRCERTPLQFSVFKKLKRQLVETATSSFPSPSRLFISDRSTKKIFLIDTGSDISCFPRLSMPSHLRRSNYLLQAANNSKIATFGQVTFSLNIGLRREFKWKFVIAEVSCPIIGSDFLAHYALLPDCKNACLFDNVTGLSAKCLRQGHSQTSVKSILSEEPILNEFPNIIRPTGKTTPGPPVFCRPRRLAPDRLRLAQAEFDMMVKEGIARRADSPWASPLHMVPKKTGDWRP